MNHRLSTFLVTAVSLTLAAATLSAADRVRTGQWEFTSLVGGQTQTSAHCVKEDEAGQFNGDTKTARSHAEKMLSKSCSITEYDASGDSVSYTMRCGTMTVHTKGIYRGDSFEADLVMKSEGRPDRVTHTKARRVGVCP